MPAAIGLKTLRRAMDLGRRIDASDALVVEAPAWVKSCLARRGGNVWLKAGRIPPFAQAAFQIEPMFPEGTAETDPTPPRALSYRNFEALSLAARCALLGSPVPVRDIECADVESGRKERLKRIATPTWMPVVVAADIARVLHEAALAVRGLSSDWPSRYQQTGGLQIVGCRIGGDAPLDLSGMTVPFPVSFIGCVFEHHPLLLNNSEFVSLDISGSAMAGLEARGLRSRGGVHFRRCTIRSPVSFSGARIGGVLDGSDSLITAMQSTPRDLLEDANHGVLNLSKAVIDNEVMLERARIWGGLSLRGTEAGRSISLNGALVAAPLGVLEKWAFDERHNSNLQEIMADVAEGTASRSLSYAEHLACHKTHDPDLPGRGISEHDSNLSMGELDRQEAESDLLVRIECAITANEAWGAGRRGALFHLLSESLRARSHAIRADGLILKGNLFAEHLHSLGTARFKSATISGSIRLAGSMLRSGEVSRHYLNGIGSGSPQGSGGARTENLDLIDRLRREAGRQIDTPASFQPQDFALDLRETTIGADVSFSPGTQSAGGHRNNSLAVDPWHPLQAELHGVISAAGANIRGSLIADEVRFCWKPTTLGGGALAAPSTPDEALYLIADPRPATQQFSLILRQCRIGADLSLMESADLWGLQLEEARIEGRLRFCRRHNGKSLTRTTRTVELKDRATNVRGVVNLDGTRVGGECNLVFDPANGPTIKATAAVFDSRLSIYPADTAFQYVPKLLFDARADELKLLTDRVTDAEQGWKGAVTGRQLGSGIDGLISERVEAKEKLKAARDKFVWAPCTHHRPWLTRLKAFMGGHPRGAACERCRRVLTEPENGDLPFIDLRDARTHTVCHPPSAWPVPGKFSLEGFRYTRSSSLGPLPPIPPDDLLDRGAGPPMPLGRLFKVRTVATFALVFVAAYFGFPFIPQLFGRVGSAASTAPTFNLSMALAGGCLVAAFLVCDWQSLIRRTLSQQEISPGNRRPRWKLTLAMGVAVLLITGFALVGFSLPQNALDDGFYASLVMLASGLLSLAVLRWYRFGRAAVFGITPTLAQRRPLALEYLRGQRSEYNRFQALTSRYRANESYRVAAQALREAGRYVAGNEVEEERLRRRMRLLSWRQHFFSKSFLTIADLTSGFGFKIDRLGLTLVATVAALALTAHLAANSGLIQPSPPEAEGAAPSRRNVPLNGKCRENAAWNHGGSDDGRCPGWTYAIDLLFPIDVTKAEFELNEQWAKNWLKPGPDDPSNTSWRPGPIQIGVLSILRSFEGIARVIGGLLLAFVGTAIASRAEAALRRADE